MKKTIDFTRAKALYNRKSENRVRYTICDSETAETILMIFSFFRFVSAPNNRITVKTGKFTKNIIFPEKQR